MNKISKNQKGFTVIEALLVILVVAVIGFGGYYVWNTQHKPKTVNTTAAATKTTAAPTPTKPPSAQTTQYLKLTQLGIEIPLNNTLSGLYYWWDGNEAWLLSPSLNQYAAEQAPGDCVPSPTDISSTNSKGGSAYQEIGAIYKGTGGPEGRLSTTTVNGQVYTFVGASSGCSASHNIIDKVNVYEGYIKLAFSKAQAIN